MTAIIKCAGISVNIRLVLLTCPANRPHSAVQCVSEEQPDCSDRQSAANSRLRSLHSPILLSQQNNTAQLQQRRKTQNLKTRIQECIYDVLIFIISLNKLVHYHLDYIETCTYTHTYNKKLKVPLL